MRPSRVFTLLVVSTATTGLPAQRQEIAVGAAPPTFRFDGRADEWQRLPATFALHPMSTDAPRGRIWLGTADTGLIIAGAVTGPTPRWAATADGMARGNHVEVWLADGDSLVLPRVGWGNQFVDETLASADDCRTVLGDNADSTAVVDCRAWYRAQQRYRRIFRRLFVRQWQLAPLVAVEAFARPAYGALDEEARRLDAPLEPVGAPALRAAASSEGSGYQFEIVVPWSAFPPLRSLEVARLRVMVDVFDPGPGGRRYGPFSTTSAERRWGDVRTLNAVTLASPRRYGITACGYPLQAYRAPTARYFGYTLVRTPDTIPTYYFPTRGPNVRAVIGLENEAHGYAYEPEGHSPIASPTAFFTSTLGNGAILCGPPLRYRHGAVTARVDSITLDSAVQVRPLPDGTFLLRNGPRVMYSYYGSGQCGACPRVGLTILHLDTSGATTTALQYFQIADAGSIDIDLVVSENWDSVVVYRSSTTDYEHVTWRQTIQCFDPTIRRYGVCAERDSVPEPTPRHIVYEEP